MAELPSTTDRLEHLRRFSYWLDEGFQVPGTRLRFGLDPIIGLVPGIGDAAGAILAAAILFEANRRGVSRSTLVRMAANIALDTVVGSIPVVGDLFDAAWKANLRNFAILERHLAEPQSAKRADRLFVALLAGGLLVLGVGLAVGSVLLATALLERLMT